MQSIRYSFYPKPYNLLYKDINFETEMPMHMHNEFEFVLCQCGADSVIAKDKIYNINGFSLFFFPTNCIHKINIKKDSIYKRYVLTISPTWLKTVLGRNDNFRINSFAPSVISLNDLEFKRLEDLFYAYINSVINELGRLSILFSILESCESLMKSNNNFSNSPINLIMEYINDNISSPLKITDIADAFFFNPDYLCRLFKKHTNITISQFINMQRISIAREMLDSGNSIQNTQISSGFNNYSHFARTFKKFMNMTPKQYQNQKYYLETLN